MTEIEDRSLDDLAALLLDIGAIPTIRRAARSTLHDARYQITIALMAYFQLERQGRVLAAWLKLAQFVAGRPVLQPSLQSWLTSARRRRELELTTWHDLPRGYLTDGTHTHVREYLVAGGVWSLSGSYIIAGDHIERGRMWVSDVVERRLFSREYSVLLALAEHNVTQAMLGADG